jgi:hypothetical protein
VRLRPLTEAECYARCYGDRGGEVVSVVRLVPDERLAARRTGERIRELFEERLDARGPEVEAA